MGQIIKTSIYILIFALSPSIEARVKLEANKVESIAHFRAFKPKADDTQYSPHVRQIEEDENGYIWIAGDPSLVKYDGYTFKPYLRDGFGRLGLCGIPFLFKARNGDFWAADCGLHKYDIIKDEFISYEVLGDDEIINYIEEADNGRLFIAGDKFGMLEFDTSSNQVVAGSLLNKILGRDVFATSLNYDALKNVMWVLTLQGLYKYNLKDKSAEKVFDLAKFQYSQYDLRDVSLDKKNNHLWIATVNGLIKFDTDTYNHYVYGNHDKPHGLPTPITTTTFIDSNNNLWVGTEKEGLCLYKPYKDSFICLRSEINKINSIPKATIEDISEDSEGSLWLSVNQYGSLRISPDLEKIITLKDTFSNTLEDYFPHTFDAIIRENGDVWLATDGGGINIFNYRDKSIRNIKHDPNNSNSLPANSVISLTEDRDGNIWAGFWAGGISKINPDTMTFTNYKSNCTETKNCLHGNSIFVVEADSKNRLWISVWGKGIQYFDIDKNYFSPYVPEPRSPKKTFNKNIVSVVENGNKIWFSGGSGLEYYDYEKDEFTIELEGEQYSLTGLAIDDDEFYIGSRVGLIKYNIKNKNKVFFKTEEGLSDNAIVYLHKYGKNIWIATSNGISIFDSKEESFKNIYKKDGLISNSLSTYGEFFKINGYIYATTKYGISVIDPNNLPKPLKKPKTVITSVNPIINKDDNLKISENQLLYLKSPKIENKFNSLKFNFSSLSFVFPEKNKFKYRLKGWKDTFTQVDYHKRVARFTNLSPGKYTFEVYSSNSMGIWDDVGVKYSFTILAPWFQQWWAILLFFTIFIILIFLIFKIVISIKVKNAKLLSEKVEKELSEKVAEKTYQLELQAIELKKTGDSLSLLNSELEERVEKRTAELQIEINERRVAESKLFHMAFHDSLTGLPNREWLIQRMELTIRKYHRDVNNLYCLMFLDGDRFKQINDTHGHIVGDQLLISAAKRLSSLMGEHQFVTRLGGDEFTIFAEQIESEEQMKQLAQSVIESFSAPFSIENNDIHFHVSIGIVICDHSYELITSILRDADIAMYKAKEQGKGTYKIFDTEMRTITLSLAELENDLHNAIENNEFYLVYQPIIDLNTNRITAFEALIRWEHPTNGNIPPLDFIPLAEETGLIWDIGAWVIDEALSQMKYWHTLSCESKPTIAVNISSGQLKNSLFLSMLDEKITKYNIDSKFIKLELTESVLMENNETVSELIKQLNDRNIDLAIDDFGTGYSSLAYLNEIPVQQIKIDKRFIDAIDATASGEINQDALAIVKATISLGKSLRKKVTAEGIESKKQLDALINFGCDYAQGYYIAKPLKKDDAEKIIQVNKHYNDNKDNRKFHRDDLLNQYIQALKKRSDRLRDRPINTNNKEVT